MIAPSQGIHLVFDRSFLPGQSAIMVPHTIDGRVMFAIPWRGHTLVGTTDTPIPEPTLEPSAREEEIEFILKTAGQYLHKAPSRGDVLSVFTGIRPLVTAAKTSNTAALSRDHTIHIDASGLLTIAGGKWTTYRHMAEDWGLSQSRGQLGWLMLLPATERRPGRRQRATLALAPGRSAQAFMATCRPPESPPN
jgi:glycerol-3-phosphate dehydrogenase